jgi:hypothetical protein
MLLEGDGQSFVEWYYEYLEVIFNQQIPLMKIAQRAKVKLSIDDYKKRCSQTTKAGSLMSRMAHMELSIIHKLNVKLGDVIYYVNNGNKASQGDVQKVNKLKKGWTTEQLQYHFDMYGVYPKESDSSMIQINCYKLDPKVIEENPEMTGDYNISRAIATFNKRIGPLLVVFKDEVRDGLLVTYPDDRGFFTKDQCTLINGVPFKQGDQDTLEEVLTLSEGEVKYWGKRGLDPNYIYELAEHGWEEHIN